MKYKILVVDDLEYNLASTRLLLERWGYLVDCAQSGEEALQKIRNSHNSEDEYAVVLLDYRMPDKDGAAVAREIRAINSESIILIFSADDSRDALKEAWMSGAVAFLEKDVEADILRAAIEGNCRKFEETSRTLKAKTEKDGNEKVIASIGMAGQSGLMAEVAIKVLKYRGSQESVLILGETGTGKELIARALHMGPADRFRVVNCATYQGNTHLLESELFGYEKGAFTGAQTMGKVGILESAMGGTIFFDEVHRLSLEAQGKLLRVLQEKKIRRVGGTKEYPVNFRIIAAGKPDLEQCVEANQLLPDLYYRLNVLPIEIPPLRDRPEDIAPLVNHFCKNHFNQTGQKKQFLMKTVRYLEGYHWPGNVRELENTVRKLLVDCTQNTIDPRQLDSKFFTTSQSIAGLSYLDLEKKHEQEKRQLLTSALYSARWTATRAASRLGLPASTMYDLMDKLGIQKPQTSDFRTSTQD